MNRTLFAKELRGLQPFALGICGLMLVSWLFLLATKPIEVHPLTVAKWLEESHTGTFAVLLIFGLLVGAKLLLSEREQGTLLFLEGLPVSRSAIFWTKTIAALLVLALLPALGSLSDVVFGWAARTSLDGPFPWRLVALNASTQLVASLFLLAVAMVLSFTRAWFALVTGLLFWGYVLLRQRGADWIAYLDPYALIGSIAAGAELRVPWRHLAAQAGAGVGLLLFAWMAFLVLGDRMQFALERVGRRGCVGAVFSWLRWLAPVAWFGALVHLSWNEKPSTDASHGPPLGERAFARKETARYEFLYRKSQAKAAEPLMKEADAIHDQVVAYLHTAPAPARLVVDLASPVASHVAGLTNWTKIRMPLDPEMDLALQREILGHETTHVFIEQLSNGRLNHHFSSTRCLHEGLATHVEHALFANDEIRARSRREVAGAWSRGPILFEQLVDDAALARTRDPNLAYPLGNMLAGALVTSQGAEAPARLLRAFARKQAPAGLEGAALWRDAMQAAGLSVDRLAAAYETQCAKLMEEEKAFVASLPRLSATVETVGREIVVRPKFAGAAPGRLICYTTSEDPLVPQFEALSRTKDGAFTWPRARVSKPVFRYLLGWLTEQTSQPVFEPWVETPLTP